MESCSSYVHGRAITILGAAALANLLAWPVSAPAQPAPPTPPTQPEAAGQPTAKQREDWRKQLQAAPRPTKGCYTATYPETQWREVPCKAPPTKPYAPRVGGMTQATIVGGAGPDFTAVVTGHITQAEGSFDTVTGVTATPAYSLQLNTDFFSTSTCSGSPSPGTCRGWEQFVYESSGTGFIQYWLINYGPSTASCPAPQGAHCVAGSVSTDGWCPFTLSVGGTPRLFCAVNAANAVPAPAEPATSLSLMHVTGVAAGSGGATTDSMTVTVGASAFSANGDNRFPDLRTQWQQAEFNVFGNGGGSQAVFNSGASATVRVAVDSGTSAGPGCALQSFTAESNNMTLQNTPPAATGGSLPALVFAENNPAAAGGAADCSDAVSLGDTHLTTFSGTHYDFQAAGDFLLAEARPDFVVQTRQTSGAPVWPNAALNRAVATRMGRTTVALCLAPTQLLVNNRRRVLANHSSIGLPDGITLSRIDDLYVIQRDNGDAVRLQLNHGSQPTYDWINVSLNLGDRSLAPRVRGLLGNPDGDANLLGMADGTVLKQPVSFEELYHRYGESWRVPRRTSLLCSDQRVVSSDPKQPFYAGNLGREQQARARAMCTRAGVKEPAALDDCVLDVTVLGTDRAAVGLLRTPHPVAIWQAGSGSYR